MVKKSIILLFSILLLVGCDMAMDSLNVTNGAKYIVTLKRKDANDYYYKYHLIRAGDRWHYDYHYIDTANFNVGDTLVLTIKVKEK